MESEFYEVRFHFPNYSLTLDKVSNHGVQDIKAHMRHGNIFETKTGEYNIAQINPTLVTHVEYNVWRPF